MTNSIIQVLIIWPNCIYLRFTVFSKNIYLMQNIFSWLINVFLASFYLSNHLLIAKQKYDAFTVTKTLLLCPIPKRIKPNHIQLSPFSSKKENPFSSMLLLLLLLLLLNFLRSENKIRVEEKLAAQN